MTVYKWCLAKNFKEQIVNSQNYFGLCALICLDGLLLFSMSYVRKNAYNLFLYSHIFFLHALLVVVSSSLLSLPSLTLGQGYMHHPQLRPYIYCAVGIYGLDRVLRMCKTRLSTATIRAIPELGTTRIEFPDVNKGWRAGQHVRIQVLSSAMGVTGWAEPHPFTIASRTNSPEGLVLMCKKTGTWTQKLYAAAVASRTEAGPGRRVKIMVEGPYGALLRFLRRLEVDVFQGGPGFAMFNSYSAALFIVGGSGISFALGAIQELIQQDAKGESRVRVIGSSPSRVCRGASS
jgi:predicted ferric reductase